MQLLVPSSTDRPNISLIWNNLSVTVDKLTSKSALDNVSGCARAGRILALIGPSGSGKTTLITLLSGRPLSQPMTFNSSQGRIYLNNQLVNDNRLLLEQCGYVEQPNDLGALFQSISVREHLVFQAMLRMPIAMSDAERYAKIQFLLERLRLNNCEHTLIGRLSGGEAKRVLLASCLLTNPPILLFDDGNSGLDSHLILSLMRYIRSLNKTTIIVLHQPSVHIMALVDDLCLWETHGRTVYLGPRERALSVFNAQCPLDVNPTDFFLEQLAHTGPSNPVVDTLACERILHEQLALTEAEVGTRIVIIPIPDSYRPGFFWQMRWLLWRSTSIRNIKRLAGLLAQSLITALIYGLLDYGLERRQFDQITVQNVGGLLFRVLSFITRACSLFLIATTPVDHTLIERESSQQRLYSIKAYYISKCLADTPITVLMVWLFTTIIVLCTDVKQYLLLCMIFITATLCSTAQGSLLSTSVRSNETRLIIWMPISQMFTTVSGFYVNTRSIPWIVRWFRYTSLYYHSFSLALISQWSNVNRIRCWSNDWNKTSIDHCYHNGDQVLYAYNVHKDETPLYWAALIGLTILCHVVAYAVLVRKVKR